MTKRTIYSSIIVLATLGACAPMEQAPLVYSSSQTIGVDVSAGEPESPAFNVNIGYSGKDKAFVPVAVAKLCRASTDDYTKCLHDMFEIEVISGNSAQGDGDKKPAGSLEFYSAERDRYKKIADNAVIEIRKLENTERSLNELQSLNAKIDGDLSDEERQQKATLSDSLADVTADGIKAKKAQFLAEQVKAQKDVEDTGNIISGLLQQGENFKNDEKRDALSVYGSFSGNANGETDSASIGVGKVFSTGVAAQNLTQGIGQAAVASACFASGEQAIQSFDQDKKEAAMEKLFNICFIKKPDDR